jgi:hypothetical protein
MKKPSQINSGAQRIWIHWIDIRSLHIFIFGNTFVPQRIWHSYPPPPLFDPYPGTHSHIMVGSSNGARKTGKAECTPFLYLSTRDPPPFLMHELSVEALVGTPPASPLVRAPPPGWLHRHSPVSSHTSCHTTNPRCSSSASKVRVRHRQEGLLPVDWPTLRHGVATCMLDRCARASLPWCATPRWASLPASASEHCGRGRALFITVRDPAWQAEWKGGCPPMTVQPIYGEVLRREDGDGTNG